MAIDFNILKPQAMGGAVGSVSSSASSSPAPAGSGLNGLAGGFMDGLLQGQQAQANSLNMDAKRQDMDQKAQLFPDQLRQQAGIADSAEAKGQMDQMQLANARKQAEAFAVSYGEGRKVIAETDPKMNAEITLLEAQTKNQLAQVAEHQANGQTKVREVYNNMASTLGSMMTAASAAEAKQPGAGQEVYNLQLKMLPQEYHPFMPEKFTQATAVAAMGVGSDANLNMIADAEQKNATPEMKNTKKIGELQTLVSNGTATDAQKNQLNELQKQTTGSKPSAIDTSLAKADATAAVTAANNRETNKTFRDTLQQAREQLADVPDALLGPIAGLTRLPMNNEKLQVLKSTQNALALQAKEIYKLGSGQGFTDADRNFLTEIVGNTSNSKRSLKEIMDKMSVLNDKAEVANWKRENNIRKGGNEASYKNWLEANPEPVVGQSNPVSQGAPATSGTATPSPIDAARQEAIRRGLIK